MRRTLLAALVGALVISGLAAQPASAKSKSPSKVGLVSFYKSDYDRSTNKATMWIDWPNAKRAEKYEVFVSRSYSMKGAKKYTVKSSKTKLTKLSRGKDYFVQVRGVNGSKRGSRSTTVGHTTIPLAGPENNLLPLRIMSYNVCSRVCGTATWTTFRQAGVYERAGASGADIIATQEADNLVELPGYAMAANKSAKRIFYNPARLAIAPATTPPAVAPVPNKDINGCDLTYQWGQPMGYIFLGFHDGGCRYAVWTEFVDIATGRQFMMVDVHLVTGGGSTPTRQRREEMNTLLANVGMANTKGLQVLYAGDFNSHRGSSGGDVVGSVMNASFLFDGFDLARRLFNQHVNSFQGFKASPSIGYKYGDHIDKVWGNPTTTRFDAWYNFANFGADGRLVQPNPSDHSPILVDLRIG